MTKRDLLLHILPRDDTLIQTLRDVKHAFVMLVFDVVTLDDSNMAFLFESGTITSLTEILDNNGFLTEEDSLVILKILLLAIQ